MVRINENDDLAKVAEKMNGREYREELDDEEEEALLNQGIVVAFGYSDDNIEFRGFVNDEVGAWSKSETLFDCNGIIRNECDEEECPNFQKLLEKIPHGTVSSKTDTNGYTHEITADFPHVTFEILEDGGKYCRGIAFMASDVILKAE